MTYYETLAENKEVSPETRMVMLRKAQNHESEKGNIEGIKRIQEKIIALGTQYLRQPIKTL